MSTVYTEMMNAILASILENELDIVDNENGWYRSVFTNAAHALNEKDYGQLLKTVRKTAKKLRKQANGCPSNPFKWIEHYNT